MKSRFLTRGLRLATLVSAVCLSGIAFAAQQTESRLDAQSVDSSRAQDEREPLSVAQTTPDKSNSTKPRRVEADTSASAPASQADSSDADTHSDAAKSESNAEIAVEAYEKSDAGPVEDWGGCPPAAATSDVSAQNEDASACDPEAAINESPQKD